MAETRSEVEFDSRDSTNENWKPRANKILDSLDTFLILYEQQLIDSNLQGIVDYSSS